MLETRDGHLKVIFDNRGVLFDYYSKIAHMHAHTHTHAHTHREQERETIQAFKLYDNKLFN